MLMPRFMVPISCCPWTLYRMRLSVRAQVRPAAELSAHEPLAQRRVGRLRRMTGLLARHCAIAGYNDVVIRMLGMQESWGKSPQ
jgi:hypothetical protein